jgi:1,4-alpha-glucan branching enzyme
MRVLVLSADYPPRAWSGIGAAVALQARAMTRQGVEVDVLLPPGQAAPDVSAVRVHELSATRFPLPPRVFDVVHLHSLCFSELALQLQSRYGLPLVYTAHALLRHEVPAFARRSGWGAVQDRVLARSDHVLFPSEAERRRAPTLHRRGSVLRNGVEPARLRSSAAGPIVFAGRFAEGKGVLLLREIVERIVSRPGPSFVFAGGHGDGPGERTIELLVRRFSARCRCVGWLAPPALERLLAEASIVLVPSRYEPFGMVALEAMRVGTPVLAASVGGLRETVRPGSGGMLVESPTADSWCEAICRLLHVPGLRVELSRRGPEYVAKNYDPDRLARTLVERVYRPLAERPLASAGVA